MIDENKLVEFGAIELTVQKGNFIFHEHEIPRHYYQIKIGQIKMLNISSEGKTFAQGVFSPGQSFGEPPLFDGSLYPACARAEETSVILKLSKRKFFTLLKNHQEIHFQFTKMLASRLAYKAMILRVMAGSNPEERILSLIDYLKQGSNKINERYLVPKTRQQLADLTGLRVETVIRAVKNLELEGKVNIIKRKIYR